MSEMKNVCVFITGGSKTLSLSKQFLTGKDSTISVKHATVFWKFNNITNDNKNYEVTKTDNTKVTKDLKPGYWDFQMIKTWLEAEDILIEPRLFDNTCDVKIKSGSTKIKGANLKKIGKLLGFHDNHSVTTSSTCSPRPVDVNHGLRYLKVSCNLIDPKQNIGVDGAHSTVMVYLPITPFTRLNGTVSKYSFESKDVIPLKPDIVKSMIFSLGSNSDQISVDADVLLTFSVNI